MADTNNERVGKALDLLKEGLAPFVAREVKTALADKQLNTRRPSAVRQRPDVVQASGG